MSTTSLFNSIPILNSVKIRSQLFLPLLFFSLLLTESSFLNAQCVVYGGTISTTSSTTVCALDGVPDVINAVTGNNQVGSNYGWLITDAATGTILSPGVVAQNTTTFSPDLEGAPAGTCQIWVIAWNGMLSGANQGDNVSGITSTLCFNISNSIDVLRKEIDGGTISTTSPTSVCALDGVPDIVNAVTGNDQVGDDYGWVITDAATGTILSPGIVALNSPTFSPDLEGAPAGTCQIWVISWNGTLTGGAQGTNVSMISSDQCFQLSNSIDVVRTSIEGGTISTTSPTTVCALDGVADVVDAIAGNDQVGDNYGWLITDAATGTILSPGIVAQNSPTFSPDLEGAPIGTCQIWLISWVGTLSGGAQGSNVSTISSTQCFDLSNSIDVVRNGNEGGTISTISSTTVCALDGVPDIINAVTGNNQVGENYGWLITDAATGTILSPGIVAQNSPTFSPDLEGAPAGTCQIWVITWTGNISGATQGANVSGVTSDQCFDLSNSIDVVRNGIDGGSISTTSSTTVCALDSMPDIVNAVSGNDQVGDDYGWLITDAATGTILSPGIVAQNSPTFSPDLEGAPVGTCQIWVISWNGTLSGGAQGSNVSTITSNQCFALSNPIDVVRQNCSCMTDGGTISTTSPTTVCALDGVADVVDAVAGNNQVGDDYGWLITDAATGTILSTGVVAQNSPTFSPDLEGAPAGTCQIWVISWDGMLSGATQGANVSGITSTQCFDFSNSIDVVRNGIDGGTISTTSSTTVCALDGVADVVDAVTGNDQVGDDYGWLITDAATGTILSPGIVAQNSPTFSPDLEGAPAGTCQIWVISWNGTLTGGAQGTNVSTISSNQCFALSNPIDVVRKGIDGGTISTMSPTSVCALDGVADVVNAVAGNDQVGDNYGWVITDAATGTILSPGVVAQNSATFSPDLEGAPAGTCQIWVISWNGMLSGGAQGTNVSTISSNQCFALSNPIDVVRKGIDGGTISTTSDTVVCALDGMPDIINAVAGNNQVGENYGWLITDAATGTILSPGIVAQNTPTFSPDLEGAPVGTCQIWLISWNGNLTGGAQGTNVSTIASDQCFALSNPIDVKRENCSGCMYNLVTLDIQLDKYPGETTWKIITPNGTTVASGGPYPGMQYQQVTEDICLPDGCYKFIIKDSYGDGICCYYGNGYYELSSGGTILASGGEFHYFEKTVFCVGTASCTDGMQNGDETGVDCGGSVCPPCQATCDDIDMNDFEAGYGIWNDGGSDVRRNSDDAPYANGTYAIRLRDNTGGNSSMFTDVLALGSYQEVSVDFSYYARSMEAGEDFWFDASINGGATWIPLKRWISGIDFNNNQRYSGAITMQGNFTNNTRFRIRCDASSNYDYVYIDDVNITACPMPSNFAGNIDMEDAIVEEEASQSTERVNPITNIKLYPNPISDNLNLQFDAVDLDVIQMQIIDFTGRKVHDEILEITEGKQIVEFNAQKLAPGAYFVYLTSGKTRVIKKFIVAR